MGKLGLKRLRRFTALFPRIRPTGKPAAVHDIRVASRRLQQILDYFYPAPRPAAVRRLRARLRRSRRLLGKPRDYDVFIAAIEQGLRAKRLAPRPLWIAIRDRLKRRRVKLMKKAYKRYVQADLPGLCSQLEKLFNHIEPSPESPPPVMATALARLWRDLSDEITVSLRTPRPANIHAVRIKAKRLRYLLEVAAELDDRRGATRLQWLRRLQRLLGAWHDLEVQEQILLKLNARRPLPSAGANGKYLDEALDKMHGAKADIERRYLRMIADNTQWQDLRHSSRGRLP